MFGELKELLLAHEAVVERAVVAEERVKVLEAGVGCESCTHEALAKVEKERDAALLRVRTGNANVEELVAGICERVRVARSFVNTNPTQTIQILTELEQTLLAGPERGSDE